MAQTTSNELPLGTEAPEFRLYDTVSGKRLSFKNLDSDVATVIMFICNHCPFVKHINPQLVALANDYIPKGISFIAISSNDAVAYPDDSPGKMKLTAKKLGYKFPYLYDETQEIAKAFGAACTPDFFIYDKYNRLVYHGQLDDSRPSNDIPVTGKDIRHVLDLMLSGNPVPIDQKPSIGCNIKWKRQEKDHK